MGSESAINLLGLPGSTLGLSEDISLYAVLLITDTQ
jgi:hypothetical protein